MKVDSTKPSLQKDVYYATLLEWATRDSEWLKTRAFAPGGWAVDFCYLYIMYRALNAAQPKVIAEYGLGQTTRMLSQYSKYKWGTEKVPLATIEHDENWKNFYNASLDSNIPMFTEPTFKLLQKVRYGYFPEEWSIPDVNIYDPDPYYKYMNEFIAKNGKAQFVSIDAPFGTQPYSRVHLLDWVLYKWLDFNHFVIMVDDIEREGEQNTVKLFLQRLDQEGVKYHTHIYSGEKKHQIIVSDDLRFLCSM